MSKRYNAIEAGASPTREGIIESTLTFRRAVARHQLSRYPQQRKASGIQAALNAHMRRVEPHMEETRTQAAHVREVNRFLLDMSQGGEVETPGLWYVAARVFERKAEVLGNIANGVWVGSRYMGYSHTVPKAELATLADLDSGTVEIETAVAHGISLALESHGLSNVGLQVDDWYNDAMQVSLAMPVFNNDRQPFNYREIKPNRDHRSTYTYEQIFAKTPVEFGDY